MSTSAEFAPTDTGIVCLPFRHLGYWLCAAVLACNLAVIVFAAIGLQGSKKQYDTQAEIQTRNLAQAIDQSISNSVDKIDLSLRTITHELEAQLASGGLRVPLIRRLVAQQKQGLPETLAIGVAEINGKIVIEAHDGVVTIPGIAEREYFSQLRAGADAGLIISKPLKSRTTNDWTIVFARRYNRADGSFAGVVAMPVSLDYFDGLLSQFEVGQYGEIVLRDIELGLITRYLRMRHGYTANIGESNVTGTMRSYIQSGAQQATKHVVTPFDQRPRAVTFQRITKASMYVSVAFAEEEYLAPWYRELWKTISFLITFALITAAFAALVFYFWRRQLYAASALQAGNQRLGHMAHYDMLTDLPNRILFTEHLDQAIAQANLSGKLLGLCYLDLDGFKSINDAWGYQIGNQLLLNLASRMQTTLAATDLIARLGGDEFVVLLNDASRFEEIETKVGELLKTIAEPLRIEALEVSMTASIGITIYPSDAGDADALIRHADQAMYIAKHTGKNRFHLFDTESEKQVREHYHLYERTVEALSNNELCLYYQPKVNMREGTVIGAEALLRWQHPERGLLLPGAFLPRVEGTDFSIVLGEWVLRDALRQMSVWITQGMALPISVNIAGNHLQRPDFVSRLSTLLAEFPQVRPQMLELEILETTAMEDIENVTNIIAECSALGVSFALDDFGTGYSSLTYFRRLPTQLLKIDQSFVRDMLTEPDDLALVESIIGLARTFRRQVIAEGVETIQHGIPLMQFGCDLAQGFGIARPMPAQDLPAWVRQWREPEEWQEVAAKPLHWGLPR